MLKFVPVWSILTIRLWNSRVYNLKVNTAVGGGAVSEGGGEGGNNPGIQTNNNFSFRNCLPSTIFSVSISNLLSCRSGIHKILKLGLRKRQVRPSSLLFSTLLWSDAHRKMEFGSTVKFYIRTVPNFYLCASFPMEFVHFLLEPGCHRVE